MTLKKLLSLILAALMAFGACAALAEGEAPAGDQPAEEAPAEEAPAEETPVTVEVGAVIGFGRFEQDNDPENGPETIQWRVMAVEDGRALLVSDKALTARAFNDAYTTFSWADSSLRAWLNGAFIGEAFDEAERSAILETQVDNGAEQGYSEYAAPSEAAAEATADRVFILSYGEIQQYFTGRGNRRFQCELTPRAEAEGAYKGSNNNFAWWWLRSPGAEANDAAGIRNTGKINHRDVTSISGTVRPALWIDVAAAGFTLGGE